MKLKKFLKAADHRVTGGSEYQWECFGPNAQFMDVSDINGDEIGGCIYDRETQKVYEVELYINTDDVAYRWIDPEWSLEYGIEAERRNVDKFKAYDDVEFTQVETEDEILDLTRRIVHDTYVHSKSIKAADPKAILNPIEAFAAGYRVDQCVNPAAAWPFPPMGKQKYVGQADKEKLDGADEDWALDDEDGFDVDAFRAEAGAFDRDPVEPEERYYEVLLTVRHRFTVKARNMEAACDKAKEFQQDMKSGEWPKGLCWEDRWVTKVGATKRLETVSIED